MPSPIASSPGDYSSPSSVTSSQGNSSHIADFNAAASSGSNGGVKQNDSSITGSAPGTGAGSTSNTEVASLIKQLIPLLQQLISTVGSGASGASAATQPAGAPTPAGPTSGAAPSSAPSGAATPTSAPSGNAPSASAPSGGQDSLNTLVPQLISLLQQSQGGSSVPAGAAVPSQTPAPSAGSSVPAGAAVPSQTPAPSAGSGGSAPNAELTSLIKQLVSLLQQALGTGGSPASAAVAGSAGGTAQTATLIKELIAQLQPQGQGAPAGINAQAQPQAPAAPASYNPGMGIPGSEIDAMLASANGTGPQVNFADYDKAAASFSQSQGSPTAGGQVSNLSSQVGNEAA